MEKKKHFYTKPDMAFRIFKSEPIMAGETVISIVDLQKTPSNVKYTLGNLQLNQ